MIFHCINSLLSFLTRPFIAIEKYILLMFQSFFPQEFDERSWYILFGVLILAVLLVAYFLSRLVVIQDADDDPVYQKKRLQSIRQKHSKIS